MIALSAIMALWLWEVFYEAVDVFFGWSSDDFGPGRGRGYRVVLNLVATPVAAELMVFAPKWRTAAIWVAAGLLAALLLRPVAQFKKDLPTWLLVYDVLAQFSLTGVMGSVALWATSTRDGTFRWTLALTSGIALLVLCLLALTLPSLRARRHMALLKVQQMRRDERERRQTQKMSKVPKASPPTALVSRASPPQGAVRPPERAINPPAHPRVMDNASAQRAMLATSCHECGSIGYDVETYAVGGNPLWYLGRCPSCGNLREFHYG
ncbi:hypothetical protein [Streptomyces beihaiensis]|uniref:Uncharacterized protein n=1 Tax=Streptomyces beihaiensis TaxID=2984495 RepID=A0ABT3TUW0_9ACTN|nr:hypothetical protein [Streptomyces beihaiensis]MCX3060827.1 hypothetical protein [Streptomyces beihaiensis]